MKQQDILASAQIIAFNPILKESPTSKEQYFLYLRSLIRLIRWDKRKYTKAQLNFYKGKLYPGKVSAKDRKEHGLVQKFCYLLPYDLAFTLGLQDQAFTYENIKALTEQITTDFSLSEDQSRFISREFEAALGHEDAWTEIVANSLVQAFREYLYTVKDNLLFLKKIPYNILITATMSAGKSTLINALVGKNISLTQNMACTSKIHTILSKPIDDGITSEFDHDLSVNATKLELLTDNDENQTSKITVSTYFNSLLGGKRVVLFDSPGVNSSDNKEHTQISLQMIKSRSYKLMLYVMNATQLGTTDEEKHLEEVKARLGRAKILFIMNKADQLISEDDNFIEAIESQRKFLIAKGFKKPIICPVSSRAAFLVKKSQQEELNRIEQREMDNYADKFDLQSLSTYYEDYLKCDHISAKTEGESLFKNCGFAYLETIISNMYDGGNIYGTSIR